MRMTLSSILSFSHTSLICLGCLKGLVLCWSLFGNLHLALDCADHPPSSFGLIFPTLTIPSRSWCFRFTLLAPVPTFFPLSPFIVSLPCPCFYFTVFLPLLLLFLSLCQVHPSNYVSPFPPLPFLWVAPPRQYKYFVLATQNGKGAQSGPLPPVLLSQFPLSLSLSP